MRIQLVVLATFFASLRGAVDTLTYTNKYSLYNLPAVGTTVANAASALFPASVDTNLYLGDSFTGANAPSKNVDFGLVYSGQQISLIKASNYLSISSNWIQSSGTTLTMWAYIVDGQREYTLMCKTAKNSGSEVADRLCFGLKDGVFTGTIYNETLKFDISV